MTSTIALVTDSSSQLPPELASRFGVRIVPVTLTIDGRDHLEGVDLSADEFFEFLERSDGSPELATTQPSAAAFAEVFDAAIADGQREVLAIVVGSAYSGARNSAELAARMVAGRHHDVVIEVVDSGTASFGISCAVWAAADALAAGGGLRAARQAAIDRAAVTSSVFVIDGLTLARRSGRFAGVDLDPDGAVDDVAVLTSGPSGLDVIGSAADAGHAIDLMVEFLTARGEPIRVAVGRAGPAVDDVTAEFRRRLVDEPTVREVVDYRVGPSIALHTGPNTVGAFVFPG